jgi:hypothetical protein
LCFKGWRWIFIVFGLATMLLAFVAYFLISALLFLLSILDSLLKCFVHPGFLVDFPTKQTYLSPEETAWVIKRIDDDRGDATADVATFKEKLAHLMDWRVALYAICFGCSTLPAYAFSCKLAPLPFYCLALILEQFCVVSQIFCRSFYRVEVIPSSFR